MLNRQSSFQDESHPGHTVSDKAVMQAKTERVTLLLEEDHVMMSQSLYM